MSSDTLILIITVIFALIIVAAIFRYPRLLTREDRYLHIRHIREEATRQWKKELATKEMYTKTENEETPKVDHYETVTKTDTRTVMAAPPWKTGNINEFDVKVETYEYEVKEPVYKTILVEKERVVTPEEQMWSLEAEIQKRIRDAGLDKLSYTELIGEWTNFLLKGLLGIIFVIIFFSIIAAVCYYEGLSGIVSIIFVFIILGCSKI